VYEILQENNLCKYYDLDNTPGISQKKLESAASSRYSYLDDPKIVSQLTSYNDGKVSVSNFVLPQVHCSSCIWLLEKLYKLNNGIIHSEVNFVQKTVNIKFNPNEISLRQVVELLTAVGYEPQISLDDIENKVKFRSNKSLYYKIVAGFCFGNIML
jgi:Cu+-exporting ATPase